MGKSIGVMPCPKCRSEGRDRKGNNLIMYDNGSAHCFVCGYDEQVENEHKHKEVNISEVKTSKKDELHHGIGLRNVQRILSLYHSSLELEYQNGWFHAVCLVPNILIA